MLKANAIHSDGWREWADEALIKINFVSPIWLVNLVLSESETDALKAISEDIGLENESCSSLGIDVIASIFGFVYEKALKESIPLDEVLGELFEMGDFAQFIDSEAWREYQRDRAVDLSSLSKKERIAAKLLPLAGYAVKHRESMLKFQHSSPPTLHIAAT